MSGERGAGIGGMVAPTRRRDRPIARFDDTVTLSPGRSFATARGVLVAAHAAQVRPLLKELESCVRGGSWAAGFVAYEAAPGLDPALVVREPRRGEALAELPAAWFVLLDRPDLLAPLAPADVSVAAGKAGVAPWTAELDASGYVRKVAAIRAHIAAGDTYQANLTYRFGSAVEGDPFHLYRDLALAQRAPYCAFLDTGRFIVASASPELFFEWDGREVTCRPMKGTAARGRSSEEDDAAAERLHESEKDRAENVMIVDLVRNDLGRLATFGSVVAPDLFDVERYETLWQMTSTVRATTRPGTTLEELFVALFPSGSVTGAPKVRTMQLLAALEPSARGVYCGALGLLSPEGSGGLRARFSVPIRTVVIDGANGDAIYGTGGGITWLSDAAGEQAETRLKALVLTRRVEEFSLVETMAFVVGAGVRNRAAHLARLGRSATYFGFAHDPEAIARRLDLELAGLAGDRRVRLVLARNGAMSLQVSDAPARDARPVLLALDHGSVRSDDVWLFHKTTRRTAYEEARARHPAFDDVILVNERGELTETTIANLAVRLDQTWWTPPLDSGCLPGIERARLLATGRLRERILRPEDVARATGLATCSSLRGWRPTSIASRRSAKDASRGR